jgi:glycosyltransferase involved in cell wall biosynthesis
MNEARNLPYVFARLPVGLHEVILVDGHSTDGTTEIARALCPDVGIVSQTGRGKGDALAAGFSVCSGDIIVTLDADGSNDAAEIPLFVGALMSGADFVKGSRVLQGGGSTDLTRFRSFGNARLTGLVNLLFRARYTDLCYGYNAFWARHLPAIDVDCNGFEVETLILARVAQAQLRVLEVPSFEASRIHGASNLRALRDGWRVLKTILAERFGQTARTSTQQDHWPPSRPLWNGVERRSGVDRRSGADRRSVPRGTYDRRGSLGRRASDRPAIPHVIPRDHERHQSCA